MPSDTIESVDGPLIKGRVFHQYRSFVSRALLKPEGLKNLVPQTLGKTAFDFVTFLAGTQGADIGAKCSIGLNGLIPAIRHADT